MRLMFLLIVSAALLAACGEQKREDRRMFDAQQKALEKARKVEEKLRQGAEAQRQAIERAGEGQAQ